MSFEEIFEKLSNIERKLDAFVQLKPILMNDEVLCAKCITNLYNNSNRSETKILEATQKNVEATDDKNLPDELHLNLLTKVNAKLSLIKAAKIQNQETPEEVFAVYPEVSDNEEYVDATPQRSEEDYFFDLTTSSGTLYSDDMACDLTFGDYHYDGDDDDDEPSH